MPRMTPFRIALACGITGDFIDVTSYASWTTGEGVTGTWGRQDEFRDVQPGTYSFILDNYDGRFTPNNLTLFSATTLASSATAGATTISSTATIPAGSHIVVGTGSVGELATTGTPTGSGPYTIPLLTPLRFAHSAAVAVGPQPPCIEGMSVCWQLGTRLIQSSILSVAMVDDNWGRIQVTTDDALGNTSRNQINISLADSITTAATRFLLWRMDDAADSGAAIEANGNAFGPLILSNPLGSAFGKQAIPGLPGTQLALSGSNTTFDSLNTAVNTTPNLTYPLSSMGFWGFWIAAIPTAAVTVTISYQGLGLSAPIQLAYGASQVVMAAGQASLVTVTLSDGLPHFVSIGIGTVFSSGAWNITVTLYIDGVSVGSAAYLAAPPGYFPVTVLGNTERQPASVNITALSASSAITTATISRLSHTLTLSHEELAIIPTETGQLLAVAATTPEISLVTPPTDLSPAPLGFPTGAGRSSLDAFNDIARTEQGYLDTVTTGTLLAPTQQIRIRARNRPASPTYTFDAITELASMPQFIHDITNMIANETVTSSDAFGNSTNLVIADSSVTGRVGSASNSDTVLLSQQSAAYEWGTDRINRGKNQTLRVLSVSIDALTTPTDRSADLLGMVPGDRVRIQSIPATVLGFSTWDGWFIGRTETHSVSSHLFTLYLQLCTPRTGIFDTDLFMGGGDLSLAAPITAAATSMSVATIGASLETVQVPYTLLIDFEQVAVTACTSAVPQVATITRGVNGTTAAAHSSGASVEIATSDLFAF